MEETGTKDEKTLIGSQKFMISPHNKNVIILFADMLIHTNIENKINELTQECFGANFSAHGYLVMYVKFPEDVDVKDMTMDILGDYYSDYITSYLVIEQLERDDEEILKIWNVCTSKSYRKGGFMKALVKETLALSPCQKIWVSVALNNPLYVELVASYTKMGFHDHEMSRSENAIELWYGGT